MCHCQGSHLFSARPLLALIYADFMSWFTSPYLDYISYWLTWYNIGSIQKMMGTGNLESEVVLVDSSAKQMSFGVLYQYDERRSFCNLKLRWYLWIFLQSKCASSIISVQFKQICPMCHCQASHLFSVRPLLALIYADFMSWFTSPYIDYISYWLTWYNIGSTTKDDGHLQFRIWGCLRGFFSETNVLWCIISVQWKRRFLLCFLAKILIYFQLDLQCHIS
jgi:hypothetical protein